MSATKTVVYVAGPFRAVPHENQWLQWQNIMRAAALAHDVWMAGGVAICPHLNTAFFEGSMESRVWLDGDLEILRRCDAILMTEDWEESRGACAERDFALAHRIPVFYTVNALRDWLRGREEGR
uniref:DUF4406 domain-containing protein n=1 Tax=viral metagenome TaxID=1070528 RepID=A0A6M3LE61_9ZZZZ